MARGASADDSRRRSDEAIRRIRAESGRRVEQQGRVRAFSSWCALATLAGGISLAALDAHEQGLRERAAVAAAQEAREQERAKAAVEEANRRARAIQACARLQTTLAAIDDEAIRALKRARTEKEVSREVSQEVFVELDALVRANEVIDSMAAEGCERPGMGRPDIWTVF